MNKQTGLTLIEMLISLAILAIVITAVSPSIQSMLIKNRIVSEINELSAVIQFARNNAIDQQITTTVCPSADYSACSNNWNNPKMVFVDSDGNGSRADNEELLASSGPVSANNVLTSGANLLQFAPGGEASVSTTLLLCNANRQAEFARALNVTLQGRVKMSGDSDRNGVHEDASGNPLSCN